MTNWVLMYSYFFSILGSTIELFEQYFVCFNVFKKSKYLRYENNDKCFFDIRLSSPEIFSFRSGCCHFTSWNYEIMTERINELFLYECKWNKKSVASDHGHDSYEPWIMWALAQQLLGFLRHAHHVTRYIT